MSRDTERQRAKALNASDARSLINQSLPFVLQKMTAAQVDQVQRVLDAAVINPAVQKEMDDLNRKSIRSQSGRLVHQDPDMVNRTNKLSEKFILVSPSAGADWRVRLDFEKLLTPEALKPTTDNPDEAAYLLRMKATLVNMGVWLRFDLKLRQDSFQPMVRVYDSGTFRAWLSVGSDGQAISSGRGPLTREGLLRTQFLAAGYWEQVHHGPFQELLSKAINRLIDKIKYGKEQHLDIARGRRAAPPLVSEISGGLGGADYPDVKIWDQPQEIVLRALKLNENGDVMASNALVIIAAAMTSEAAKSLHRYIDDSSAGAERAVKVLGVVKTVGHIAEAVLVVRAVAVGLLRLARTEAAATGARATGAGVPNVTWGQGALNKTNLANAPEVYADTLTQAAKGVTADTGMVFNRYTAAEKLANKQALYELETGINELTRRGASLDEKIKFLERFGDKWGHPD